MRNTGRLFRFALVLIAVFCAVMYSRGYSIAGESKTLENLLTAYNGESNAHAKYLAYAEQADKEGYGKVASLFRAAAKAEEIHLNNHARVITAMGVSPRADIKLPAIKSTKENIEDGLKGESYERDTMYPGFIAQAEQEKNTDAVRTFTYARDAEAEHAKLYGQALNNLEQWKVQNAEFSVCPTCGLTVQGKPEFTSCPVCSTPSKLYQSVI